MEVSFKAQFINRCNIQKYSKSTRSFLPSEVSFIELDTNKWRDRRALRKISKKWEHSLADNIYRSQKSDKKLRIFALTEQQSNFEKLDAEKVLGLTQLQDSEPNVHYIDYLQTKPVYTANNPDREYKDIGRRILDNLKNIFRKDTLKLSSLYEDGIIDFYIKNNFKFEKFYLDDLIWVDKFEKQ